MIISFSGRPGSGKTTLIRGLMAMYPDADYLHRVVTREQRDTDIDARYSYVTEDAFDAALQRDELFMPFSVHGYRVAYTKDSVRMFAQGGIGCVQFSHKTVPELTAFANGQVIPVHVLSPTEAVLSERLRARGEDPAIVVTKLKETHDWDSDAQQMDTPFIFIKNDGDRESAVEALKKAIHARLRAPITRVPPKQSEGGPK